MRAGSRPRSRREVLNLGLGAGLAGCIAGSPFAALAQQGAPLNCAPINPPANATPFAANAGLPMRVRKSAFDLTPVEVDRLKAAFAALRKRSFDDPLDPRGWLNQAHVHCWYCGGPQGDGIGAGVEIHGTWNFMPWHRAYLYFFERILGRLIDDDTFALPYWDWNTVRVEGGRQTLPHASMPLAYIHPNGPSNPLRDDLRLVSPSERIPAAFVGPTMMNPIMDNVATDLFFGTPPGDPQPVSSMVEFGPHGVVHLWVGDPLMRDPIGTSDMGVLATAAQDPIFFAHHANIDRIWENWLAQGNGRANPASQAWLDTSWTFFNEENVWTSIKTSDVIDHQTTLRYQYQPPIDPNDLIAEGPVDSGPVVVIGGATAPIALAAAENVQLGPLPQSRAVALPDAERAMLTGDATAAGTPVIRIAGVRAPVGGAAIVRVFVNLPAASSATPVTDPHYVGYFTLVPNSLRGAHTHGQSGLNVELPLRPETRALIADGGEMVVTLVPVSGDESPPLNVSLTIDSITLTTR